MKSPIRQTYSTSEKTVLLSDWWLVKTEVDCVGRRLTVGGITETLNGPRVFLSTPIIKRISDNSLETSDGFNVIMYGLINEARCRNNGFSLEVCTQFLIGFPYNWEECADNFFAKEMPFKQELGGASVSDLQFSGANSEKEFVTPVIKTYVKEEIEFTIHQQGHIKASKPLKKEDCNLTNSKDLKQNSICYASSRKSFAPLESLNLRRTRSGRVIVPRLNAGSQNIVYDSSGAISGILTDVDDYGSLFKGNSVSVLPDVKSECPRKKKR